MARKKAIANTPPPCKEDLRRIKASTPLCKREDGVTSSDIIKNDDMLFKVNFMAQMMLQHRNREEIQAAYLQRFGEEIGPMAIRTLKDKVRALYLAETLRQRDEMVADELMHAEWELRELQEYWERSKAGKHKTVHHQADSQGEEANTYSLDETTETDEQTFGDLEAMRRINDVRTRVIRVLGLEAPKQQSDPNNRPNAVTINIVDSPKQIVVEDVDENIG